MGASRDKHSSGHYKNKVEVSCLYGPRSHIQYLQAWVHARSNTSLAGHLFDSETKLFMNNHIWYGIYVARMPLVLVLWPLVFASEILKRPILDHQTGISTHIVLQDATPIWSLGTWRARAPQFHSHVYSLGKSIGDAFPHPLGWIWLKVISMIPSRGKELPSDEHRSSISNQYQGTFVAHFDICGIKVCHHYSQITRGSLDHNILATMYRDCHRYDMLTQQISKDSGHSCLVLASFI